MKNTLQNVLRTLNQIEVKGMKNIDYMLGCMQALDTAIKKLDEREDTPANADNDPHPNDK